MGATLCGLGMQERGAYTWARAEHGASETRTFTDPVPPVPVGIVPSSS